MERKADIPPRRTNLSRPIGIGGDQFSNYNNLSSSSTSSSSSSTLSTSLPEFYGTLMPYSSATDPSVKTADNRVIHDQLQQKICECEELQETVASLKLQLSQALDLENSAKSFPMHVKENTPPRDVTAEVLQQAHMVNEMVLDPVS